MKKILMIIIALMFLSGLANASILMIEVKGGYYNPGGKYLRENYEEALTIGGEVTFGILPNMKLWVGGNYFSKSGIEEGAKLALTPIGGGLKYKLSTGVVRFYGGAGISYTQYKESKPAGDLSKGQIGLVTKVGALFDLKGGLVIDLFFDYHFCKVKPADTKIDIGGVLFGIGIGFEFFI